MFRRPSFSRFAVAGALALALAGVGYQVEARALPAGVVVPGLRVAGVAVIAASNGELRRHIAERAARIEALRVLIVDPEDEHQVLVEGTLADFGAKVDVDATVRNAIRVGHEGDVLARADVAKAARDGKIDLPLTIAFDLEKARARLLPLKEEEDVTPVSARLDLDAHTVVPEKDGRALDVYGAALAIERAAIDAADDGRARAPEDSIAIPAPFARVAPRFTASYVKSLDVHAVLAAYDTYFSRNGDQRRRGKNVDVAAAKLDGVVMMPGELFSFNAIVGERSEENGFAKSWEILKGEMVEGVGGGTCQVASTLHAAAFFGGLEILERLPHSRPSAYIPMGLDATVVYPEVDMKLRNPFSFPVVIHAKVEGNKLHIELLGAKKPAKVTFGRELVETKPYSRKVEEDETLREGMVRVKQHGIRGYTIKRKRVIVLDDGKVKREEETDRYPPTVELDEVPPGFDEARLPPLPEDADGGVTEATAAGGEAGDAGVPGVQFIEAPGAHAPTAAQVNPPERLTIRH